MAEWRASGREHALRQGGDRRSHLIKAWSGVLLPAIEARADISLIELTEKLAIEYGVRFAPSTIWRCLDRHDMTVKKTAHASEPTRLDVAKRREAWFDSRPDLNPSRLVFIDETSASTKMARLRGRSRRGTRCQMSVPHGYWKSSLHQVSQSLYIRSTKPIDYINGLHNLKATADIPNKTASFGSNQSASDRVGFTRFDLMGRIPDVLASARK